MKGTKESNSKHKIPNTNKGITLIALVITIIVMLILVAVTITMAVNGGLFDYASNAGTQTNGAIANEQELANLEADMTVDELIDKYTGSQDRTEDDTQGGTSTITFEIDGTPYTAETGMTWEQWIVSTEYNSGNWKVSGSGTQVYNNSGFVICEPPVRAI